MRTSVKAVVAASAVPAILFATPLAANAAGGSVRVPNSGFVRSVCDTSLGEAQYVVSGTLHIVGDGRHLNGQAMKGIGVKATYDSAGNPVPVDAHGNPIALNPDGTVSDPSLLVPTGTKYTGNFRDNTVSRTLSDGTVWAHITGGSTITGTNGTVEVNSINAIAIFPAGTTDFESAQPLKVLHYQAPSSCHTNGVKIY